MMNTCYKVILVHIDRSRYCADRVEWAANIALEENAHLIGAAMTGVSKFLHDTVAMHADDPAIVPYLETLRQQSDVVRRQFEDSVKNFGASSFESRAVEEEIALGISTQARYCDLVILGKYDREDFPGADHVDLPAYVALQSGCPVLIVPPLASFKHTPRHIVVAWNPGSEARQAVQGAMPLLQRAGKVQLLVINPPASRPGSENDIALYLSRHDVGVELVAHHTSGDIGRALLSFTADSGADLLVMGCYGHTRLRELLLGGVTRTVLSEMTVPVLMQH